MFFNSFFHLHVHIPLYSMSALHTTRATVNCKPGSLQYYSLNKYDLFSTFFLPPFPPLQVFDLTTPEIPDHTLDIILSHILQATAQPPKSLLPPPPVITLDMRNQPPPITISSMIDPLTLLPYHPNPPLLGVGTGNIPDKHPDNSNKKDKGKNDKKSAQQDSSASSSSSSSSNAAGRGGSSGESGADGGDG